MSVIRSNENLQPPHSGNKSISTGDLENHKESQQSLRKVDSEYDSHNSGNNPKGISRTTSQNSNRNSNMIPPPDEQTPLRNTRQSSTDVLSPELQLRVVEQYNKIEQLKNMFAESEINQDTSVLTELDDLIEETKEVHKISTNEHVVITSG